MTEIGMLLYWLFAGTVALGVLNVSPEYMYSDYKNPVVVSWNWSFFPLDILFALLGLCARFGNFNSTRKELLSNVSLSLMFCAGLMAVSFWVINGDYEVFWWSINLWLLILSSWVLIDKYRIAHI